MEHACYARQRTGFDEFGRHETRGVLGTIASLAVAAASIASAGVGAAGSAGAFSSSPGGGGNPRFANVPRPRYEKALDSYITRYYAANVDTKNVSFSDFLKSGGEARMDVKVPDFTPKEATDLGFVGRKGEPIPFVGSDQTSLTTDQALFLGKQRLAIADRNQPLGPLEKAALAQRHIDRLQGKIDSGAVPADGAVGDKIDRMVERRDRRLSKAGYPGGV